MHFLYICCCISMFASTIFFCFFFCFYFHLLFLTLVVTRHIVQFTMFDLIHCSPPFLYLSNIQNHYVKTLLRQKTEYHFVFCFCFKIHTKKDFLLHYANNFICSWIFSIWVRITINETPHDSILHRKLRKYKQRFKTRKKNGVKELLPSFKKACFLYKSSTVSLYYKDNLELCYGTEKTFLR